MSGYVLVRVPDGAFVSKPGFHASYTHDLRNARVFATREAADAQRCKGNESIQSLADIFGQ